MKPRFANFTRSNRSLFAVAILCVLAMKGFSFLCMASALAKHPGAMHQSLTLAILGTHCDQHQKSGSPEDQHAHHTECCVLCSGGTRDAVLDDPALTDILIALLTPRLEAPPVTFALSRHDPLLAFSTGLFSDWSPTAPPVV